MVCRNGNPIVRSQEPRRNIPDRLKEIMQFFRGNPPAAPAAVVLTRTIISPAPQQIRKVDHFSLVKHFRVMPCNIVGTHGKDIGKVIRFRSNRGNRRKRFLKVPVLSQNFRKERKKIPGKNSENVRIPDGTVIRRQVKAAETHAPAVGRIIEAVFLFAVAPDRGLPPRVNHCIIDLHTVVGKAPLSRIGMNQNHALAALHILVHFRLFGYLRSGDERTEIAGAEPEGIPFEFRSKGNPREWNQIALPRILVLKCEFPPQPVVFQPVTFGYDQARQKRVDAAVADGAAVLFLFDHPVLCFKRRYIFFTVRHQQIRVADSGHDTFSRRQETDVRNASGRVIEMIRGHRVRQRLTGRCRNCKTEQCNGKKQNHILKAMCH